MGPDWGCFALLAAEFPHDMRASGVPFDKSQEFFISEERGEPTVHLPSDLPPAAPLGIWLSCDSEDSKKNLFSPALSVHRAMHLQRMIQSISDA